jgi:hypothetical protein
VLLQAATVVRARAHAAIFKVMVFIAVPLLSLI